MNKPTLQETSPVTTWKSTEEEMDLSAKVEQECIWITIQDLSLIAPDLNEGDDTTDEKAENAIKSGNAAKRTENSNKSAQDVIKHSQQDTNYTTTPGKS